MSYNEFESYFHHLNKISLLGFLYKRYFMAPILFREAKKFGHKIIEIGSGIGNGILGAYTNKVLGLEVNPIAVEKCLEKGLNVKLIEMNQAYPIETNSIDACVLDNVLEHINDISLTMNECLRVTKKNGGLIVAVPGLKGFLSDEDHKILYDEKNLKELHPQWVFSHCYSSPFFIKNTWLSKHIRQYCLIAVYIKA